MGNVGDKGETGARTLEEALEIARQKSRISKSQSSILDLVHHISHAGGVVGCICNCSSSIFGGIAGAFFIRGKSGKYAAMGRG